MIHAHALEMAVTRERFFAAFSALGKTTAQQKEYLKAFEHLALTGCSPEEIMYYAQAFARGGMSTKTEARTSRLMIEALTAEDNRFRCFRLGDKWLVMRGAQRMARTDRPAMAFALLRSYLAYGKAVSR